MAKNTREEIRIDSERRGGQQGDFLRTLHRRIRHRRPDGTWSEPYQCDSVQRSLGIDAVAMVLHYDNGGDEPMVGLRSSRRPALLLDRQTLPECPEDALIWEIPAGILEAEDVGLAGRATRCSLEALEEMGAEVPPEAFSPLGHPIWLSPGVIAERVYLFEAAISKPVFREPEGDGSVMEQDTAIAWLPLGEALQRCRAGLSDAKTEVALARFSAGLPR